MNPQYPTPPHQPVHTTPKPPTSAKNHNFILFSVIYVILLILSVSIAYSSQSSKLEDTKQELSKARSELKPDAMELVDQDEYQGVFLNNDQVYFGKIDSINQKYLVITDIFYLQNNKDPQAAGSSTTDTTSLVKLGCELHKPEDKMVINLNQVNFWENLESNGQVAKAIKQFYSENSNGQSCNT